MRLLAILSILSLMSSCATGHGRFLIGAGAGAAGLGTAGAILSPNEESRGLNALVFGLVGALLGGGIGLLTTDDGKIPESKSSLREQENGPSSTRDFVLPAEKNLPDFVRKRLQPAIVEETLEQDSVSEDGTLHEPHRIYRIKRPAELYSIRKGTTLNDGRAR